MARTRQELATSVMQEMGLLDAMGTPTAEDANLIKKVYDDKLEHWRDEELVYWEADEIPNAIFIAIRDCMMLEVGGSFGQPSTAEEKQAREDLLLKRLRRHMARKPTGTRTMAEYF